MTVLDSLDLICGWREDMFGEDDQDICGRDGGYIGFGDENEGDRPVEAH